MKQNESEVRHIFDCLPTLFQIYTAHSQTQKPNLLGLLVDILLAFVKELENDFQVILSNPQSIAETEKLSNNLDARFEILSSLMTTLEQSIE